MRLRPVVLIVLSVILVGSGMPASAALSAGAAASPVAAVPAKSGDVVIEEIALSGPRHVSDSFVELRNVSDTAVSLDGWLLVRCDDEGLRAKTSRPDVDFRGVSLAPGERFVAAQMSAPISADAVMTQPLDRRGAGHLLVSPDGATSDAVGVFPSTPHAVAGECGGGVVLPVALAAALAESWQRTASGDWVRARATPGASNAAAPAADAADSGVRIVEVAAGGAAGAGDDLVEVQNTSRTAVDVSGWRVYRCAADGRLTDETLQHTFSTDTTLEPGESVSFIGPDAGDAPPDSVRWTTSMADLHSGVAIVTADGRRVDGVTVSSSLDTACQTGDVKLAAVLDHRSGESWQRTTGGSWLIAPRTPGAPNARSDDRLSLDPIFYGERPGVVVSEIATDPAIDDAPAGFVRQTFVELGNFSDEAVDISGWRLVACGSDGYREPGTLATAAPGTVVRAGATWTAALAGTAAARTADARLGHGFALAGAGVWLEDATGRRIDSVGIFHRNEMDESVEPPSPCTKGLSLATFAVDRVAGESYQRSAFTGDDARDFVAAPATPGRLAPQRSADPAVIAAEVEVAPRGPDGDVDAATAAALVGSPPAGAPARVLGAWSGASDAPLTTREMSGERALAVDAAGATDAALWTARDDAYALPYVRLRIASPVGGTTVTWSGRTVGRAEVRLSVWDPQTGGWRQLDAASGARTARGTDAEATVTLSGEVRGGEVEDGAVEILVQVVPRTEAALDGRVGFADPDDYDLSLAHITDTQYYSEAYPEVYAAEVGWIARNAHGRKIAQAIHTGDLVQSYIDPDQTVERARREFEVASAMQGVLAEAGVPASVLPGNHDNKRGLDNDLFNEFFGPQRFAGESWYGGSIGDEDGSANWTMVDAAGAQFLVLSLPYGYGERELAWGEQVLAAHPGANVVIATHEHLTPKAQDQPAARSVSSRWLSRADQLWSRLVEPFDNVVIVLSGHFHGIGTIVSEDVGGTPGRTVVEALADYQEFRTHTGERATGFQRLLQIDLGGGRLAVDTFSVPLATHDSTRYDYEQFVPDNGEPTSASNERPWRVVERGLQHRYTTQDDAFAVDLRFQYPKAVATDTVLVR